MIPLLLKDADVERLKEFVPTENRRIEVESLLPGPVSDRVAVVDLREDGTLGPALQCPEDGRPVFPSANPYREPQTIRWSVFATVLETMKLFESEDCLGRRVAWAFGGPQLLVVPDAGEARNAFYHRESRSLQFFRYARGRGTEWTSASHDVVAHETGHAVLDGIAPWLYDASSPQSLAIHESIADLTALFAALASRTLTQKAIEITGGNIQDTWLFSAIAYGLQDEAAPGMGLRSLVDEPGDVLTLSKFTEGELPLEPHDLSVVLSRAFYAVVLDVYESQLAEAEVPVRRGTSLARSLRLATQETPSAEETSTGRQFRAFLFAGSLVKRLLLRGLDYLPPGDAGLVDLARAVLACDRAAYPEDTTGVRSLLEQRLTERHIGTSLTLETPFTGVSERLSATDLNALVDSDWVAMQFVEQRRRAIGVPDGPFEVFPRLFTKKVLFRSSSKRTRSEVILKVGWKVKEPAVSIPPLPELRLVRRGATVVFDRETGEVCAFVAHTLPAPSGERDRWIATLAPILARAPGLVDTDPAAPISWRVGEGAYEMLGTGRALHIHPRRRHDG